MKAMILCAGRGERMRPLSDVTPKPLLKVKGKELVVWHIEKLVKNGFKEVVINIAHLGHKIVDALGDGSKYGIKVVYSDERDTGALESAGGIKKALDFLGSEFLVVNGDVFCEYEFDKDFKLQNRLAHLILVKNPPHNQKGDFGLIEGMVLNEAKEMFTFSGIGYYSAELFRDVDASKTPLAPLLRKNIDKKLVSGEYFDGLWRDIGTPQRLKEINGEML